MDDWVADEEQLAQLKLRQKLNKADEAARKHLYPINEYINFILHKAFHKCSYECFDKSRRTEERTSCLQNCDIPFSNAKHRYKREMAGFHERLNRSILFCREKFEDAKLQKETGSLNDFVSCANKSVQDNIKMLPHLADALKASLGMTRDKYGTQMDDSAAAEMQLAKQKVRPKINEVSEAVEKHLSPIRDYITFILEKAFHKCAYECFDKTRRVFDCFDKTRWAERINSCHENCDSHLCNAQQIYDSELENFHGNMQRSILVCQYKYKAARLMKKMGALNDVVSCVDESVQENIKMLPHIADTLKASLGMSSSNDINVK